MQIIHSIQAFRQWRDSISGSIGFVPTMGNLHDGHLNLVHKASQHAEHIVVSIFVNRLQFGQGEDFDRYPRTLAADAAKLEAAGVAVLFAPDESELYPTGSQTYYVEPSTLQNELCGAFRPNHFRGVATVVAKLFNIVQPNVACFGKKDYQQLAIIKNMVAELNFPIQIMGVATVRAEDGLALSSRNQYLSATEREKATEIHRCLQNIAAELRSGNRAFSLLEQTATTALQTNGWIVDYVAIRQAETLDTPRLQGAWVILLAARLGSTRLIDNLEVLPETENPY
ncbi:MAG: pantoate--beta-alanine ligase [Alysiella sp.]|uniref:pantoate--beta-alanine ligase n=1 Tax=Alysiella sp. TaxID=1872483 RepID=UPI0026DB74B3|nr:pantoate--beta-alanine ligase [Alysiella sp.]MDO4433357.1 pantoate--beta-alanine ligase [Alysiella sp.]